MASDRHRKSSASGGSSIRVVRQYLVTGDITPAANVGFLAVPGPELSIPDVAVGDNVTVLPGFMWAPTSSQFLDQAVSVGGSIVRFASSGSAVAAVEGDPALYNTPGTYRTAGGAWGFTVEAGDLEADGSVTIVLATKGNGTGTVYASANFPFRWEAHAFTPAS